MSSLQIELDTLYEEKARGAFTRSRQTWLEQGEKNTKYFFYLEKRSGEMSSLNKLLIVSEDQKEISQYVTEFYKHLYDSNSVISDMDTFLNDLGKAKTISIDFKLFCDDEIQLEEIKECIGYLKDNRSPGNDRLLSEFYKVFRDKLAPFLLAVYKKSIDKGELPDSLKQGVITLIPKPQIYILYLDNWRPISILNNDAKIFAHIFAKRLKHGLEDIIDEAQTGFIQGRHISNNIRLILDMVDYNEYISDNSLILFVDFHKAFDYRTRFFV